MKLEFTFAHKMNLSNSLYISMQSELKVFSLIPYTTSTLALWLCKEQSVSAVGRLKLHFAFDGNNNILHRTRELYHLTEARAYR